MAAAEGMIVTEGGRFGGYGLYLLKGKPVFLYNYLDMKRFRWEGRGCAVAPGKHTIVFDFTYDGPGIGKGGTGILKVDDQDVANQKIPAHHSVHSCPGRRPSTSASTPGRRWTTTTTKFRSASPARSQS